MARESDMKVFNSVVVSNLGSIRSTQGLDILTVSAVSLSRVVRQCAGAADWGKNAVDEDQVANSVEFCSFQRWPMLT